MSRKLVTVGVLVILGAGLMAGYRLASPFIQDWRQRKTSDSAATKGKITIAMDNWIGYFPLCSSEMKNRMLAEGYLFSCLDDSAAYAKRMAGLKAREFNFAVATVDSYILNAAKVGFPAVIVAVIDESKGGDAILAQESVATNINSLKGRTGLRVAFTPDSPSHHLLKGMVDHFDVPELLPQKGPLRIETDGSSKALEKLVGRQADVAVLWEPDVSRALANKGIVKILGTESTRQFIVDILLVNREYAAANVGTVKTVLQAYFRTLKVYRDNPERLEKEVMAATRLSGEAVRTMLKGVAWATFSDNCEQWFGIGSISRGLVETIDSTVSILTNRRVGDFTKNPLPDGDPSRIVWGRFLEELYAKGPVGFTVAGANQPKNADSLSAAFPQLDEAGWKALRVVGSLKIEPITFRSGTADLQIDGKEELDRVVEKLKHYPNFRVLVRGHTALSGDPEANLQLSQERAESVARYFGVTYSIDANRVRAVGIGSKEPLPRLPNESDGAHEFRLRRVEISLVSEVY
ncbi:OmpA family protein [Candidatus Parcubacteria bacterium]|nr:OmpA family protein [Candidatus Parcubacteria bacterium]